MAVPVNAFTTSAAVGLREDLSDIIYDISPVETPFLSGIAKTKATARLHEWQTDALAAATEDNAHPEGDDSAPEAIAPTVRLSNRTQTLKKAFAISGTMEAVAKAGRNTEAAYQKVKRAKEIKRDLEKVMLANRAVVTSGTPRMAGIGSWLATNTSAGSGGADPAGTGAGARTDGTPRAFTETLLKGVLSEIWTQGGDPDVVMVDAFNKQAFSAFTGGATKFDKTEDKKITAAVDFYVSDFGDLRVVLSRQQRARDVLILQMDMWALATLRPLFTEPLAKTGDAEKWHMVWECTMESRNEKASGAVFDVTTS